MRVEVVRRGGLAGLTVRGEMDLADLPVDTSARYEAALQKVRFDTPPTPPTPPQHPDSFQYEITVVEGHRRRSVLLDEAELSESLRPLVDTALSGGRLD